MSDLLAPLWLSLRISVVATLIATLVAVPLAYALRRRRFVGRGAIESLILMPMVLPPTVVGYLILVTLGARGWLTRPFDYSIVFRIEGAILAAAVVAFPLIYLPARAGFASVEREMEDVAKLMGASRWQTFWHVALPMSMRGLGSGVVLGFARALGEFGATIMVFGWLPDRETLPISIYRHFDQGALGDAAPAVLALSAASFGLILLYNATGAGRQA
jgi:molybdate transport system permease protein